MSLRPKTKRRLLVLLAGAALFTATGTVVVKVQLHRLEGTRQQYRASAMHAFARGDYAAALEGFKRYLSNDSADAEAIYAYAVSRSQVPRADLAHLSEAKSIFGRYLELSPGDPRAQHHLLELYQKLSYDAEALGLAETLLAKDPTDLLALRAKLKPLFRQSRHEDALTVARRINELDPTSLPEQKTTYLLMKQLKRPSAEISTRAEAMLQGHPGDPRFELLRAFAASLTGDTDAAKKWILLAATRTPPDTDFVRELASVLDRLGMYEQSRALLEKAAPDPLTSPQLTAALVQRLIETAQYTDALDRLKTVLGSDGRADARLLGLKAMAIYSQDEQSRSTTRPAVDVATVSKTTNRADADAIVDALSRRSADGAATAWASLLRGRFASPPPDARDAAKLYQAAIQRDPEIAAAYHYLGLAYRQLGETELALRQWRQATQLAPAWVDPRIMTARALLGAGRIDEAYTEASLAAVRAPHSWPARTTLAVIAYYQLDQKADPDKLQRLLAVISEIQARVPNEPQTLPVYVALLARAGQRDDAVAAVRAALSARPALASETLLKLAQTSAQLGLGLERTIADHLTASPARTPEAALDAAVVLATAGNPLDGFKSITTARDASAGADRPEWQLAVARYREAIADPGVDAAWTQLAQANPQNIEIQRSVLGSRSAWTNRALIDRCIDNLKSLTGPDSLDWRMARARWRLTDPDNLRDNANAAAAMMADVARAAPNSADPLVIWAAALEKLGDLPGATDRLSAAVALSRGDLNVSVALVRLLQRQGKSLDARQVLERVAQSSTVSPAGRVQIARMLSMQGDYDLAVKVLQSDQTPAGANVDRDLLLAQLQQARGKTDEAERLFEAALNARAADENVVRAVAGFHARRGDMTKAQDALRRLDALQLAAGSRELTLAAFHEQFGTPEAARAQYEAAWQSAPTNPAVSKGLAGFHLRRGDFTAAAAVAEQGAKTAPDGAELTALAACARTLAGLKAGPELQSLVMAFSLNPTDAACAATLGALAQSQAGHENVEQSLSRLRDVAEQHPRFLPVQMLLAQRSFAAGRFKDADEIASRAMTLLPTEVEPARVLSVIAAAAGRWDRALTAAIEWRSRSLDQPLPADLQIAEAKLRLNDPAGAVRLLAPHLDQAKANPEALPAVVRLYARALAQDGRSNQAQLLLEPLLQQSPAWRAAWLDIAANVSRDAPTASAWMERVTPLIGADARSEHLRLASAWYTLGQRFGDAAAFTKARALLQLLSGDSGATSAQAPPAVVLLMLGSVAQELSDFPAAEAAYQKALQLDSQQSSARNNLAYLILLRGGDLKEARQLAEHAVAAAPNNSAYQDTLARVHARSGNLEEALTGFQNALRADAGNVEALIGLADTQARAGHRDRAALTLEQVDSMLRTNPPLSEPVRKELDELRSTLKKPAESTSADVK